MSDAEHLLNQYPPALRELRLSSRPQDATLYKSYPVLEVIQLLQGLPLLEVLLIIEAQFDFEGNPEAYVEPVPRDQHPIPTLHADLLRLREFSVQSLGPRATRYLQCITYPLHTCVSINLLHSTSHSTQLFAHILSTKWASLGLQSLSIQRPQESVMNTEVTIRGWKDVLPQLVLDPKKTLSDPDIFLQVRSDPIEWSEYDICFIEDLIPPLADAFRLLKVMSLEASTDWWRAAMLCKSTLSWNMVSPRIFGLTSPYCHIIAPVLLGIRDWDSTGDPISGLPDDLPEHAIRR